MNNIKYKNDIRINKIKDDRLKMLHMVNDSLKANSSNVSDNIKTISKIIAFDEINTKKYEAIIKAQELITNLTIEISNAKTEEEIIKLRNKLNYYINKVKEELKKRNVEETYLLNYQDSVSYLRKDIAKYLRYIKRNNNIVTIENLNNNYDSLSPEDKNNLKQRLSKELRYNRRNTNISHNATAEKVEEKSVIPVEKAEDSYNVKIEKTEEKDEDSTNTETIKPEEQTVSSKETSHADFVENIVNSIRQRIENEYQTSEYCSDLDYLREEIAKYNKKYKVVKTYDYTESISENFVNLLRNIPRYAKNKKAIKQMEMNGRIYYSPSALISYIEYLKKRNSISEGLKSIFSKSYLYSEEGKLLNNHEKCANWLFAFCQRKSLDIENHHKIKTLHC